MTTRSALVALLALVGLPLVAVSLTACGPSPSEPVLCCQSRYSDPSDPHLTYCLEHRSIIGQWLEGGEAPPDALDAFTAVFNDPIQGCQDTSCIQEGLGASTLPGLQPFYEQQHRLADQEPTVEAAHFDDATKTDLIQCGFQTEIQTRQGGS